MACVTFTAYINDKSLSCLGASDTGEVISVPVIIVVTANRVNDVFNHVLFLSRTCLNPYAPAQSDWQGRVVFMSMGLKVEVVVF